MRKALEVKLTRPPGLFTVRQRRQAHFTEAVTNRVWLTNSVLLEGNKRETSAAPDRKDFAESYLANVGFNDD
jgi:hypothetical protein